MATTILFALIVLGLFKRGKCLDPWWSTSSTMTYINGQTQVFLVSMPTITIMGGGSKRQFQ